MTNFSFGAIISKKVPRAKVACVSVRRYSMRNSKFDVKRMVYLALFTALVVVLQFIPIRFGTFELALSVPVIVVGAAVCGIGAGAWLGFVFGFVVLFLPGTSAFLSFNLVGTILTVILKGAFAGTLAGVVYKLLEWKNRYIAVVVAAVVATFVNTLVFIIGSLIFFESDIATVISIFVSVNFLIELVLNMVLVPTVYRIINIKKG